MGADPTVEPTSATPAPMGSWALMEARLATARVHDLLVDASRRLTGLRAEVELPESVAGPVAETAASVTAGLAAIERARAELRRPDGPVTVLRVTDGDTVGTNGDHVPDPGAVGDHAPDPRAVGSRPGR